MDHHDDWQPWPDEQPGAGDGDTADLSGPDFGLEGHGDFDDLGPGDGMGGDEGDLDPGTPAHDSEAPDLVNEASGDAEDPFGAANPQDALSDGHDEGVVPVDAHDDGPAADGHNQGL